MKPNLKKLTFKGLVTSLLVITTVTECTVCVQGHDPLTFSFLLSFLFFDWVGILWPQLSKVLKLVRWASSVPFPPSVPAEVGCLFAVAACVHVFISGERLHCFLVGVNKLCYSNL